MALLLRLLSGLPSPNLDLGTERKVPAFEAEAEEIKTGGMKSASGFAACGDSIINTLPLVGEADPGFALFDLGFVGVSVTAERGKVALVGESSMDWEERVRTWRLDCLRGFGFGVASGCCPLSVGGKVVAVRRLRLELTNPGRASKLPYTYKSIQPPHRHNES